MCRCRWIRNVGAYLVVLGLCVVAGVARSDDAPTLKAGAATSNITPPLGSDIIGGFHPIPAKHVHDELHARVLVLDDGRSPLAIVICDLLGVAGGVTDEARKLIETECKIPAANVLIAGTHTHSAASALGASRAAWQRPPLDEYQQFLVRRIADGVRRAWNQREPAEITWGAEDEPDQVFNRRWFMKPGTIPVNPLGGQDQVKMNPPRASADLDRPAGPTDPQVSVVLVRSKSGRPIGLLANYSLHYVGGVGDGHISADYFAMFADRMTQLLDADRLDPPFVAMMSNGTSGDINNIDFRAAGERLPPYAKMKRVADEVADAAARAIKSTPWHDNLTLGAEYREVEIGSRQTPVAAIERARFLLTQPRDINKPKTLEVIYAERTLSLAEWPKSVPVAVQVLRIGDLAIGTMPCEVFAEIGLELKQRSPRKPYFTIELAHGYYGYLPTPAQHRLGGYETWLGTNRLEEQASEKLVAALLEMLAAGN